MNTIRELVVDAWDIVDSVLGFHFALGKSRISLQNVVEAVGACIVVVFVVLWLTALFERRVLRRAVDDLSLRKILANVLRIVLLALGLVMTLSAIGVDLTALSVLGGAIGVGIGFGLQKLASNYVSGFVILFERSLRIGDNVKVDGFEGKITDIKTRYTVVRSISGRESIVPNEKLITERVENMSLADAKVLITTTVQVAYGTDVDVVRAILIEAALSSSRVLRDPAPAAHLSLFAADGLEWTVAFWIADPENGQLSVKSDIHIAVLKAFDAAGVVIPYPQRVVQLLEAKK